VKYIIYLAKCKVKSTIAAFCNPLCKAYRKECHKIKINKLDFILYIKTGHLNLILYLIASLIILIPMAIVFVTNVPFSASFSKIFTSVSFVLVIMGKFFTLLKKDKGDKSKHVDIGIIVGFLIAFIFHVLD
jgi:hypothetical protein